jgi:hypothetical protein
MPENDTETAAVTDGNEMTEDRWFFLIDPAWQVPAMPDADDANDGAADDANDGAAGDAADDHAESVGPAVQHEVEPPPLAAIVGGWLVRTDGTVGRFEANPEYQPATPDSPTDPVDAALRLAARGEMEFDAVFSVLHEAVFGVALDEGEEPLIAPAPDEVPCLLVTTAPAHRSLVAAHAWREVDIEELSALLSEHEVDVLLNPGVSTSTRLLADTIERATVAPAAGE